MRDFRPPELPAGISVEGNDITAVIEAHHSLVGGEGHRSYRHLLFPEEVAAFSLHCFDNAYALVTIPSPCIVCPVSLSPAVRMLLVVVDGLAVRVHRREYDTIRDNQLEGAGGVGISANGLTRSCVKAKQVLPYSGGDVDPVFDGNQSPG